LCWKYTKYLRQSIKKNAQKKNIRNSENDAKAMRVGQVLMVPDGVNVRSLVSVWMGFMFNSSFLQSKGELKHSTTPRPKEIEDYLRCGLAADEGDTTLEFQESWSQEAVDNWLWIILPKPFKWLDARYGRPDTENGDVHWVLLGRDRKTLFVVARKTTTGAELSKMKGIAGRNPSQWSIRIGP
jgi:hypothetical protein